MQIIYGGRQCGKTTELIRMMENEPGLVMLTFSTRRKDQLKDQYPELKDRFFAYWEDSYCEDGYVVDDLDQIISKHFGNKLKAVTFTPVWPAPKKLAVPEAVRKIYGEDWSL